MKIPGAIKTAGATTGLALALTACAYERPLSEGYNEDVEIFEPSDLDAYGNLSTEDARIRGDIGDMRNLDNPATASGFDDGSYTTLEVITEDDRGAAMHWLEFYGGVNHPALQPGNRLSFVGGNYPDQDGEIHVEAMACSGSQIYAWDYDEPAGRTDLEVKEVPGNPSLVQVDYTTYVPDTTGFFGTETVSSGTFVLQR